MTRPRFVATDLDGTIIPWDGVISDRTVRALQAVEALGVPVVFVTGRPPRWMAEIAERTGHTGLAICANGALVYDLHSEKVVDHFPLSVEVGLDVAPAPARRAAGRRVRGGDAGRVLPRAVVPAALGRRAGARPSPASTTSTAGTAVVKLLARHEELDADALLAAAREVVGDVAELTHSSQSRAAGDLGDRGVARRRRWPRLCEQQGVDAADVVAFGDMPNDLPMLAWAGTSYAVEGAHPDVLAAVSRRAPAADDDGVAQVLETLFDL